MDLGEVYSGCEAFILKTSDRKVMKKTGMILFAKRPKVGPFELWPMTGGRVAILEEKGNALVEGSEDGTVSRFELFEAFFVVSQGPDQLAEAMGFEDDEWKLAVNRFSLGEAGEAVEEFAKVARAEFERIQAAIAEPKKKTARKRAKR